MPNPSGTDPGDGAETAGGRPMADNDPVTEVIEVTGVAETAGAAEAPPETDPPAPATGERRYTAPGFDAGSTQIIDRLPDDETEFIATGAEDSSAAGPPPRTAAPQAIPPRGPRRPRWLIPSLLVLAAVLAAAIIGLALFLRAGAAREAQENMVRSTIETFDTAVRDGDLATLRDITCGQTRDDYAVFDDASWAEASTRILAAEQYPVIASIDEVVINGDQAEANVTSYMAFDPTTTSTRSFDLQFRDDQWKICQNN
ncbi:MAG: DUF4878 domain-containing protein [Actinomycetia bacterium]|nr:DUF4878 domain-containing protein [Actinomycetes bacterium]